MSGSGGPRSICKIGVIRFSRTWIRTRLTVGIESTVKFTCADRVVQSASLDSLAGTMQLKKYFDHGWTQMDTGGLAVV